MLAAAVIAVLVVGGLIVGGVVFMRGALRELNGILDDEENWDG